MLAGKELCAGRQQLQGGEVAAEDGEVRHLLLANGGGDVGAIRLEQRTLACDFYGLAERAHDKLPVQPRGRVGADLDFLLNIGLKTLGFDAHAVQAGDQVRLLIVSGNVGRGLVIDTPTDVRNGYLGLGHHGARRVCHCTDDTAEHRLPEELSVQIGQNEQEVPTPRATRLRHKLAFLVLRGPNSCLVTALTSSTGIQARFAPSQVTFLMT
jgi:hypothetical protein